MTNLIDFSNYLTSLKKLIHKLILILIFSYVNVFTQNIDTDSTSNDSDVDTVFVMTKSPTGAMLRSMLIPGWGQFYNESYWKIPIIWGASAWFIYAWDRQNTKYYYYKDLYKNSLTATASVNADYKKLRNFYRDDRDLFAIYIGLTYFLNFIDAYVDAHLFDFNLGINNFTNEPELRIKYNF